MKEQTEVRESEPEREGVEPETTGAEEQGEAAR